MKADKTIIAGKRLKAAHLVTGILVVVVASLFLLSFTTTASARPFTLEGKVVEADSSSQTITLNPAGTNDEMVFNLDKDASITMCDKDASLNDLKAGDVVTLQYHEESDGHWIAEGIDFSGAGKC